MQSADFPDTLELITVTGQLVLGTPASPFVPIVTFSARTPLTSPTLDVVIPPFTVMAYPDPTSGDFTIQLPACDDPELEPNDWSYAVAIHIAGRPSIVGSATVPYSAVVGGVDLADVLDVDAPPFGGQVSYLRTSQRGAALGVAALDNTGKVPAAQLPASAGGDPDWADITGKPATFPPSAHTHTIANVTGLQTALDASATAAQLTATNARVTAVEAMTPNTLAWSGSAYVESSTARIYVGPSEPTGTIPDGSVWIDTTP